MSNSPRVCAVVVTFNRRALLAQCLRALQAQSRPVETILVVDNASKDGTVESLRAEFPDVEILALKRNIGGAGGFHAGMKHAFDAGYDWLWLMDDDGTPAPDCLEILLQAALETEMGGAGIGETGTDGAAPAVLLPVQEDHRGRLYGMSTVGPDLAADIVARGKNEAGPFRFTFVGPLLSRRTVERVGLPNPEFFIWLDDFEYAMRINAAGLPIVAVPRARFAHDPGGAYREYTFLGRRSVRPLQPAWKMYYGARNGLYIIAHAHPDRRRIAPFLLNEMKLLIGDLMYEPQRWQRVRYRLRGIFDGARGKLGKRT